MMLCPLADIDSVPFRQILKQKGRHAFRVPRVPGSSRGIVLDSLHP